MQEVPGDAEPYGQRDGLDDLMRAACHHLLQRCQLALSCFPCPDPTAPTGCPLQRFVCYLSGNGQLMGVQVGPQAGP